MAGKAKKRYLIATVAGEDIAVNPDDTEFYVVKATSEVEAARDFSDGDPAPHQEWAVYEISGDPTIVATHVDIKKVS